MGHRARLDRDFLETATVSHPYRSRQDRARKPCFSHARRRSRFGCEQCCVEDREDRQERAESVRRRNPERQNNRRTERDALDNAHDLVAKTIPKPTEAEREQAFLLGIQREIELGWCEIQNAGSYADDIKIVRKCFDEKKVKLRLSTPFSGQAKMPSVFCAKARQSTPTIITSPSARSK